MGRCMQGDPKQGVFAKLRRKETEGSKSSALIHSETSAQPPL